MNPAVTDAFALVLSAAYEEPAYPGVPGHEPDLAKAKSEAEAVGKSMDEIRKILPRVELLCLGNRLLPAELAGGLLG